MLAPTLTLDSESDVAVAAGAPSPSKSESLSPPRFEGGRIVDSPIALRQKLDYMLKHSEDAPFLVNVFSVVGKFLLCLESPSS